MTESAAAASDDGSRGTRQLVSRTHL